MILEFLFGAITSSIAITFFIYSRYVFSVNNWVIEISKFVYFVGHPLYDDDEKHGILSRRFKSMFLLLSSVILKTIALILVVALTIIVLSLLLHLFKGDKIPAIDSPEFWSAMFPTYLYKWPFLIGTFAPIIIVPFLPKKKDLTESNYTPIEKFLHFIFLGNSNVAKLLFKFELGRNKKYLQNISTVESIYVSGMARSGTTVLMQYLGQMQRFVSLSYNNLPFLFLPKTWPGLKSNKKIEEKERFHKDGVKHSLNSYEALEEPFWRNYIGSDYIKEETLKNHSFDEDVYQKYNAFRKLVAGNKTYLAKNNNHLLRAKEIHQYDLENGNKVHTVIPFREPYSHAKSLLNQHNILSQLQKDEDFAKDYMDFLVHHEFGLNDKVSLLIDDPDFKINGSDKSSVEYWLNIWYLFYNNAIKLYAGQEGFYFFCYETFRDKPLDSLLSLSTVLNIPRNEIDSISIKEFVAKPTNGHEIQDDKFLTLYKKLTKFAINNEV